MAPVVAERLAERLAEGGRDHRVERDRSAGADHAVEDAIATALLVEAVAVDREAGSRAEREGKRLGSEGHAGLGVPERAPPAIVVPTDHQDGDPVRQRRDRRGDLEVPGWDDLWVGEPEVVQVTGQQQRIAGAGDGGEKGQKRRLVRQSLGRGRSEVGVGEYQHPGSGHGAKGGGGAGAWQCPPR